ncbi:MAG: hypothetical protein ACOC41_08105 [Chitinivibrionales bacterium]
MPKALCKWKRKEIKEKFEKFKVIVSKPDYVCMKCGRVAAQKERLCCPKVLDPVP